ncbi:hypothetical protein CHS0354_035529 [Potamilus streckersoni]|uniref:Uncharacterized protein n=1 Tax=Potamilus streckersoni TaxID=2493646 RepID=A0AAE0VHW8_9BIVA|nr:hypothetical protein CHS0354_035529 [Potamilus streckersoni]
MRLIEVLAVIFCLMTMVTSSDINFSPNIDPLSTPFFMTNLEEMDDVPLVFDNSLPPWLKGTLIKNGLGRFEFGQRKFRNALDANAKLSSWKFTGNGNAVFSTRFIRSKSYNESLARNDIAPYLMLDGTTPPFSIPEKMESLINGMDNMNVNVYRYPEGSYVAVSDYWNCYELDPKSLLTIEDIKPKVPNATIMDKMIMLSTAHPLPEYGKNYFITFVTLASPLPEMKSKIKLIRVKSVLEREEIASIDVDKVPYMHSFGLTENYAVIIGIPFFVDPIKMFKTFTALDVFEWDPSAGTTLYVINIKTGKIQILKTDAIFFLHTVNAYEYEDNIIFLDIATYNDFRPLHMFDMDVLSVPSARNKYVPADLRRYKLDLSKNTVQVCLFRSPSRIDLADHPEFPVINEKVRSHKYCYLYGITYNMDGEDFLHMALVKKDVCTGAGDAFWNQPFAYLNEPWFISTPEASREDDGVLLLPMLDIQTGKTTFTIFNATDLTIITKSILPTSNPFATHGRFFNEL